MPKRSPEYMERQKQRFLDAAVTCFRRKGVNATNLNEICEESGLSMGALYKHYAARNELIEALLRQRLQWRQQLLQGGSWPQLRDALLHYLEDGQRNPFWSEFNSLADWSDELRALRQSAAQDIFNQIAGQLEAYARTGQIQPSFDGQSTARLLSLILDGSVAHGAGGMDLGRDEIAHYLDFAVGMKKTH